MTICLHSERMTIPANTLICPNCYGFRLTDNFRVPFLSDKNCKHESTLLAPIKTPTIMNWCINCGDLKYVSEYVNFAPYPSLLKRILWKIRERCLVCGEPRFNELTTRCSQHLNTRLKSL